MGPLGGTRAAHFVGVGGSGMSPLAEVLLRMGLRVSGSDVRASAATAHLESLGLRFHAGHDAAHVGDADVVVMSSAVKAGNPEVAAAAARGVPVIRRGELLAELMRRRYGIAVGGAHGKTTTTAMVALALERGGLDPTAVVGGRVPEFGSHARVGSGECFVAEADESDRSFLLLRPAVAVVTNVDEEHLESYADLADLCAAFEAFAGAVPFYGAAVLCADDPRVAGMAGRIPRRVVTYGLDAQAADILATDVAEGPAGTRAVVHAREGAERRLLGELRLRVPGRHNVQNALAAIAVARLLDVPFDAAASALAAFGGAERRFERRGEAGGVTVVDDYGHHPTEIAAVVRAARAAGALRVVVVFQPHRYSRTRRLLDQFGPALALADEIVLTDIYAAGEDPLPGVTIDALAAAVTGAAAVPVHLVPALDDVAPAVARMARPGDLVLTLGAGSIGSVGDRILAEIRACR